MLNTPIKWLKHLWLLKVRYLSAAALIFLLLVPFTIKAQSSNARMGERHILVSEYRDKMMAGWIGQMAGVGWGAPTEFQYVNRIIPEEEVPKWQSRMVNVWGQDDLYVEMTFLRSLEQYGLDVSMRQAGLDFAYSKYQLWHANKAGRDNLRLGIAPPDCSHPQFNKHADDIDYQIEADFSGLIAPGLPNTVIAFGEKFGRLVNYGDGLYAGQFVGGMYAEAFFEHDPLKIIESGLKCIPEGSQYAEMVRDVIGWYKENPDDWQKTWQNINEKYHDNPDYRRFSCSGHESEFNIDAKINGAYIIMGLLYGNGDPDQTIIISMQCGQDSDCNPSNAAGVLFTSMGYNKLPERFISELEQDKKFSYTEYNFPMLIDVCEKLAKETVLQAGGRIEKNADGEDLFIIPVSEIRPGKLEKSWEPGPIAGSRFTRAELPQVQWKWLSRLALWLLPILALLAFKENRDLKAVWIAVPMIVVLVLWAIISKMNPFEMKEEIGINQVLIVSLTVGLSLLFLLGEKIGKYKWYVTFGFSIMILAVVGIFGTLVDGIGFNDGSAMRFFTTYCMWALILLLAVTFTSRLCRKRYSHTRFLLFNLMWFLAFQIIFMILFALIEWGSNELVTYFLWIITIGVVMGIVEYLFTLPYWILAFNNKIYNQRFRSCLGLSKDGKSQ